MSINVDPKFIQDLLITGTYPDETLNQYNIFRREQPQTRRRYPSCEIIYKPEGQTKDRKQTDKSLGFIIRYYDKIVGGRDEQNDVLKQVEDEIISLIDGSTLEDPNILLQTEQWERNHIQRDESHPEYNVSILTISVKTRIQSGAINDAILVFKTSTSTVNTPPGGDYTYTEVFDTEIMEGYRTIEEQVTKNPDDGLGVPLRFRGGWNSRFLTHIPVKTTDIGTTGDKVNQLNTLLQFGEKPIIGLIFTKNTADSPTAKQINQAIKLDIEKVEYAYPYNDMTIYRVYGWLVKPSSITTT
jgi:hypothetical protein